MNVYKKLLIQVCIISISIVFNSDSLAMCNAEPQIRKKFDEFVQGYTNKDIDMTMSIFAPDVTANVQQSSNELAYQDIKNGILKDFSDNEVRYYYTYDIKEIMCTDTMAIVRIIWTL